MAILNNSMRRKKKKETGSNDAVVEGSMKKKSGSSVSKRSVRQKKKKKTIPRKTQVESTQPEDNRNTVSVTQSVNNNNLDSSSKKNKKRKSKEKPTASTPKSNDQGAPEPPKFEAVQDKANFVNNFIVLGMNDLKKEFKEMHAASKAEVVVAPTSQANMSENRYKNIQCIESTRVKIPDKPTFYYNANLVSNKFIFAQSPMPSTVQKFWEMIAAEEVDTIIQCTQFDDKKCAPYFAPIGQPYQYGPFRTLTMKAETPVENPSDPPLNLVVHSIKYRLPNSEKSIVVKNYYWKDWPAGGVPEVSNSIPYLYLMTKNDKKVLIHCSSGSGRSAVVGMTLTLLGNALDGKGNTNLLMKTEELRKKRHMALRNQLQYAYVGRCIIAFFMKHNAAEMSQSLLEFIDEYDSFVRKYKKENEEARKQNNLPGPEELSELSNELANP